MHINILFSSVLSFFLLYELLYLILVFKEFNKDFGSICIVFGLELSFFSFIFTVLEVSQLSL